MNAESSSKDQFVEVSISTTSGFYPDDGYSRIPSHQKISVQLEKAQNELKIKDVAGWIATVGDASGKRQLDPARSYLENNLSGKVEIDWGPSEGGGG